jgi:hypothetical protein
MVESKGGWMDGLLGHFAAHLHCCTLDTQLPAWTLSLSVSQSLLEPRDQKSTPLNITTQVDFPDLPRISLRTVREGCPAA